jgi:hypothetical protein
MNRPESRKLIKLEETIFNAGPLFARNEANRSSGQTTIFDDSLLSSLWLLYSYNREIQQQINKSGEQDKEDSLAKQDPFPSILVVELVKKIIGRDGSSLSSSLSTLNNLVIASSLTRLYLDSYFIEGNTADIVFPFLDLLVKKLNNTDDLPLSFAVPKNGHEWSSWISSGSYVSSVRNNNHPTGRGLYASMLLLLESFVKNSISGCNRKNTASLALMMTTSVTEGDLLDKSSQVQRLKSKLFSKIQDKRIEDLSEVGLFKFLTIFLCFSSWTSVTTATVSSDKTETSSSTSSSVSCWMEMSEKVCEITQKILDRREHHRSTAGVSSSLGEKEKNSSSGRIAVSFKSLFALLYLMPSSPSCSDDPNNSSSEGNPCNSLLVSSLDSSKVRKVLIRQIPLLSASQSKHPLAVSLSRSPQFHFLFLLDNKNNNIFLNLDSTELVLVNTLSPFLTFDPLVLKETL